MSVPSARHNRRQRGRIEELRSGVLRVSVPLLDADQTAPAAYEAVPGDGDEPSVNRPEESGSEGTMAVAAPQLWAVTVRGPDGSRYPVRHVCEDINRLDAFRTHLLAIARIGRPEETDRGEAGSATTSLRSARPARTGGSEVHATLAGEMTTSSDWFMGYLISLESVVDRIPVKVVSTGCAR